MCINKDKIRYDGVIVQCKSAYKAGLGRVQKYRYRHTADRSSNQRQGVKYCLLAMYLNGGRGDQLNGLLIMDKVFLTDVFI